MVVCDAGNSTGPLDMTERESILTPLTWQTRKEAQQDRQRRAARVEAAGLIDQAMSLGPVAMAAFAAEVVARH